MNLAIRGGTVIPSGKPGYFPEDCRYDQLLSSLPNFVFFAFGGMDSHLQNYTDEVFMDNYVKLINQTQKVATKPMVFLMVP